MTDEDTSPESLQFEYMASKSNLDMCRNNRDSGKKEFADKVRENYDEIGLDDMKKYMEGHLRFHIADDQALKIYDKIKEKDAETKPPEDFLDALANTEKKEGREYILSVNAKYRCEDPQKMLEILNENPRDPEVKLYLNRLIRSAALSYSVGGISNNEEKKEKAEAELTGLLKCSNILNDKNIESATSDTKEILYRAEQFSLLSNVDEIFEAPPKDRRIFTDILKTYITDLYDTICEEKTEAFCGYLIKRAAGASMFIKTLEKNIEDSENGK